MASPTQQTWSEQALGVGDGQGGPACCSPWGRKELDTTEWLNWTELKESAWNVGDSGSIPGSGGSAGEGIGYPLLFLGFPCGSTGREIHLQCGRPGFTPWVGKIAWKRKRLPTPVFWPGEFHGLYSPWGHKESDTTERLSLSKTLNTGPTILSSVF